MVDQSAEQDRLISKRIIIKLIDTITSYRINNILNIIQLMVNKVH